MAPRQHGLPRNPWCAPLAFAAIAVALGGCGSSRGDKTTSLGKAKTATTTKPKVRPPKASPPPVPLGTPVIAVAANPGGRPAAKLRVKVGPTIDPLKATPFQRQVLGKGQRFMGVRITLTNLGTQAWTGAPGALSTLITSADTQAGQGKAAASCGGAFAIKVEMSPRERQRGCLVFVLPKRQRARIFQFSPDSPAAPPKEWFLTRKRR